MSRFARVGSTTLANGNAGTLVFNHTVPVSDKRLLVLRLGAHPAGGRSFGAVIWTVGQITQNFTLVKAVKIVAPGVPIDSAVGIWELLSPTEGTGTVSITVTGPATKLIAGVTNVYLALAGGATQFTTGPPPDDPIVSGSPADCADLSLDILLAEHTLGNTSP